LVAIKYGVESGAQELVDGCQKNLDLSKVDETVRITKELGLYIHLTFAFGLAGETWETVNKTIRLARNLSPDTLQFSIITPFPGSTYYKELESKGYLLTKDWDKYDGYNTAVIRTEKMGPDDLVRALNKANRVWARHKVIRSLRKKWKHALQDPVWAMGRLKEKAFG